MANQEHLDVLKQGVDVWNNWKSKHFEIKADLSGANLSHDLGICHSNDIFSDCFFVLRYRT